MDESIEDAGYNDYVLCPKCQTSVNFGVLDNHDGLCPKCYRNRLEKQNAELLTACKDLYKIIIADGLIPESVSYMKEAKAAIEAAEKKT